MDCQKTQTFADNVIKGICDVTHLSKNKKKSLHRQIVSTVNAEISESAVPSPFHCVIMSMMDLNFEEDVINRVAPLLKQTCKNFILEILVQTLFEIMVISDTEEVGEFTENEIRKRICIETVKNFSPETIGLYCYDELSDLVTQIKDFNMGTFKSMIEVDLVNSMKCEINEILGHSVLEASEDEEPETDESEELEDILNDISPFYDSSEDEELCDEEDLDYEEELDDLYGQLELKEMEIELLKRETEIWKTQINMVTKELNMTKKELIDLHEEVELSEEVDIFKKGGGGEESSTVFFGLLGVTVCFMYMFLSTIKSPLNPQVDFTLN